MCVEPYASRVDNQPPNLMGAIPVVQIRISRVKRICCVSRENCLYVLTVNARARPVVERNIASDSGVISNDTAVRAAQCGTDGNHAVALPRDRRQSYC